MLKSYYIRGNYEMLKKPEKYDYNKPIKLLQYKRPWFDIMFYSFILSALMIIILGLLFYHDGQFKINFVLWRVIVCIPLVILTYWLRQLLDELRVYPSKLMKKHIWNINELMEMTGKDRKETENIMNHVLESCFIVGNKNILKDE